MPSSEVVKKCWNYRCGWYKGGDLTRVAQVPMHGNAASIALDLTIEIAKWIDGTVYGMFERLTSMHCSLSNLVSLLRSNHQRREGDPRIGEGCTRTQEKEQV